MSGRDSSAGEPRARREPLAIQRILLSLGLGLLAWAVARALLPTYRWELHALIGWLGGAGLYLGLALYVILTTDPEQTRALATREDSGRAVSNLLVLGGSLATLAGVVFALSQVTPLQQAGRATEATVLTVIGLLAVVLSWLLIQSVYTFRYANQYFEAPEGGIVFLGEDGNPDPDPDYLDFFYLATTIGMTYQVSDTNLTKRSIRRVLTGHALIGYVYGTVLIALTINGVAGLLG